VWEEGISDFQCSIWNMNEENNLKNENKK